jgi:hypothetical protein
MLIKNFVVSEFRDCSKDFIISEDLDALKLITILLNKMFMIFHEFWAILLDRECSLCLNPIEEQSSREVLGFLTPSLLSLPYLIADSQ